MSRRRYVDDDESPFFDDYGRHGGRLEDREREDFERDRETERDNIRLEVES